MGIKPITFQNYRDALSKAYQEGLSLNDLTSITNVAFRKLREEVEYSQIKKAVTTLLTWKKIHKIATDGKKRYYETTRAGRVARAFHRYMKKFFGRLGYTTPMERASKLTEDIKNEISRMDFSASSHQESRQQG